MFEKKKILMLCAASALLVSCGGGGDSPNTAAAPANGTGAAAANSGGNSGGGTSAGTGGSASPGGAGTTANTPPPPPPASGGTATPPPAPAAVDQKLNGTVEMAANQVLYIKRSRIIYLPVVFDEFESDRGLVDVAAGSPVAHIDNLEAEARAEHCNYGNDGVCGVQPPFAAPAAPLAAFGIRISKFVIATAPGQAVGNQTVEGRIAVDLTERNEAPGVGANEVPEIMRFVIDKVQISTNRNGEIASVQMLNGAQIHVYGRDAAGAEVRENIPAPAGTVHLMPLTDAPDSQGDTSSMYLLLDLETGFSQAGGKLKALEKIAGHFAMHVTFSSIRQLVRPAADGVERKELAGAAITVNDQPAVTGAGINGNAWIRMYPAQ